MEGFSVKKQTNMMTGSSVVLFLHVSLDSILVLGNLYKFPPSFSNHLQKGAINS